MTGKKIARKMKKRVAKALASGNTAKANKVLARGTAKLATRAAATGTATTKRAKRSVTRATAAINKAVPKMKPTKTKGGFGYKATPTKTR